MAKSIKQKELDHYDTMIAWAEKQNQRKKPDDTLMFEEIKRAWYSEDCSYCSKYHNHHIPSLCDDCPLSSSPQEFSCCNYLWEKMDNAKTWKTWIEYAKLVREYIKENG